MPIRQFDNRSNTIPSNSTVGWRHLATVAADEVQGVSSHCGKVSSKHFYTADHLNIWKLIRSPPYKLQSPKGAFKVFSHLFLKKKTIFGPFWALLKVPELFFSFVCTFEYAIFDKQIITLLGLFLVRMPQTVKDCGCQWKVKTTKNIC